MAGQGVLRGEGLIVPCVYETHPGICSTVSIILTSMSSVALAEIGDKTQLLTLLLVARFGKPVLILLAIILATLVNHYFAALIGELVTSFSARRLCAGWSRRASWSWPCGCCFPIKMTVRSAGTSLLDVAGGVLSG